MPGYRLVIYVFIIALSLFSISANAQDMDSCYFEIAIDSSTFTFDDSLIALDIILKNACPAGGLQFRITTSPEGKISLCDLDFTGSRFLSWEVLTANPSPDSAIIKMFGIANMPGEGDPPPLAPGSGKIGTLLCEYRCGYDENSFVTIQVDSAVVSSPSGYDIYFPKVTPGKIKFGEDYSLRSDANCDGFLLGSDISYLISYLRGEIPCPCTLRAGDTDADKLIKESDIESLVRSLLIDVDLSEAKDQ